MNEIALLSRMERFNYREPTSGCWIWTGACNGNRCYGRLRVHGKMFTAHRLSWILHKGPVPAGMFVCHRCDVPSCFNPAHLFVGEPRDNIRDMINKGRAPYGERHGRAKLTEQSVRSIRERIAAGDTNAAIARDFGVRHNSISRIRTGQTWTS